MKRQPIKVRTRKLVPMAGTHRNATINARNQKLIKPVKVKVVTP